MSEKSRQLVGEAARTIMELYFSTHSIDQEPSDLVKSKFSAAIVGAELPSDEVNHHARDTQFELTVWGMLNVAGVTCEFAEPDLRCLYGAETVGVAVKRLWSPNNARKRVSDGADQLGRAQLRGFIAINAQEYLTEASQDDDLQEKSREFNSDLARLHGQYPEFASKPQILGFLICGTGYKWTETEDGYPFLRLSSFNQLLVQAVDNDSELVAREFGEKIGSGLKRWMLYNT